MLQNHIQEFPFANKPNAAGFRPGKFRHQLLDQNFLDRHANEILTRLQPFLEKWQSGKLSDAEICAVYILIFCSYRRPQDWWSGRNTLHTTDSKGKLLWSEVATVLPDSRSLHRLQRLFPTITTMLEFFSASHLRSVPKAVHLSLLKWQEGSYRLHLSTAIPTPEDVLRMQTEGQRCVSLLVRPEDMQAKIEGDRDPLGFLLHDLIHAHHFFSNPVMARQQKGFYRWIHRASEVGLLNEALKHPLFKKDFEYITSDMNSHCVHLMMTLKAKLFAAYNYSEKGEELYRHLLSHTDMPPQIQNLALRLNTKDFDRDREAAQLTDFFEQMSACPSRSSRVG